MRPLLPTHASKLSAGRISRSRSSGLLAAEAEEEAEYKSGSYGSLPPRK